MHFENIIQVEKEYHNKTTAMRWSEAKYGIEISFLWILPERQGIPLPVCNKCEKLIGSGSRIDIIWFAL